MEKESYWPVSILNPVEKLLEDILKSQIVSHFEKNDIIPDEHHGGRQGHRTATAKMVLEKTMEDKRESHQASLILNNNLSQAYDLINHDILIQKLSHHGVGKESCEILKNFLKDRQFYVDVSNNLSLTIKQLIK